MKVFLDMDGVITDFIGATCAAHGLPNPYEGENPCEEFEINDAWKMSSEEFWAPLSSFEFWGTLEFMPDGLEILAAVECEFGKKNIAICTSPVKSHECSAGKHYWIKKYIPEYRRRFFIGSAKHFMAGPGKLLIDDKNENCDDFVAEGGQAILIPRQWNRNRGKDTLLHLITEIGKCK